MIGSNNSFASNRQEITRTNRSSFLLLQNVFGEMFEMRRSGTTKWYGDACSKLCIPFNVFCVLRMLSAVAEGRTIYFAWRSTILSARYWEGFVYVAASLSRRWISNRWHSSAWRSTGPETTAHNTNVYTTSAIQSIVRNVTKTVSQNTRSVGQRHRIECACRTSLVSKSTCQNEENPTKDETRRWQKFGQRQFERW